MIDYMGSDVLDEQQQQQQAEQNERLTKTLMEAISASDEAKAWLNTGLGKALRKTIVDNKMDAMSRAVEMEATAEQTKEAKEDYAVWLRVEQVFSAIILGGEEALKQYQQREISNEQ